MKILALDLGKYKTVGCDYEAETGRHEFETVATTAQALHDLIVDREPERVVIEICSIAGWVCELVRTLGIEIQVTNTADERWRWRKVKQKSDRRDALKTAQLSAVNQLRPVHVPQVEVRQWRALIAYRQQLVQRRTRIRNHIRDLLQREGVLLARGRKAWTEVGLGALQALVKPLAAVPLNELWRGELAVEVAQLGELQQQIAAVHAKLDELGAADGRVQLLRTIPGVGPRLAEAIVTMFDDPARFRRGGEVSAYIGMVPKQFDSGETERSGRITRQGNRLVRSLLVEVAWASLRHNPWVRECYLASTILSLCARQLPADWQRLYGYRPLLLETLVDAQFRGTSYQAANWIYLGETRGRGRMDQHHEAHGALGETDLRLPSLSPRAAPTRTKLRAALVPKGRGVMVNACSLAFLCITEHF